MKRLLLCACLVAANAFAQLKEVDTFLQQPEPPARDFQLTDGRVTGQEPRLGVPTFVWLDRRADAPDLRAAGVTPEQAARRALLTHAHLYGSTPTQLAEVKLLELLDLGRGAIVASFERRFEGRPVFHEKVNVVLSQRLEPVALSGYFAPQQPLTRSWRLAADTALAVAFEGISGTPVSPQHFVAAGVDAAGAQRFTASTLPGHTLSLARAKALWFTGHKGLVPAWYVELDGSRRESASAEMVGTVVSAVDGSVLWRRSLTQNDAYTYRVWADGTTKRPYDGPYGAATTPHPTGMPDGTSPTFTAPSLVTLEHAGLSTNDPWLPSGATTFTGNNVDAYADVAAPDGFGAGDFRASTTAAGTFDVTYDLNAGPGTASQRAAGLAQLFYVVNWLHDWFYDHGFDEAAGNAQDDNFGRGGADGDSIRAEGQDYEGFDNANMSTPTDGAQPRMQMYLFRPEGTQSVAYGANTLDAWNAAFGATAFDVSAQAVVGAPREGCTALTNAAAVVGKIAVLARGTCSFELKARMAQDAGAVGVLILNNQPVNLAMSGDAAVTGVTIGALLISQTDGAALETALGAGNVTVRLLRTAPVHRDGSLDSSVVAHEWGHYLSNRLVPGLGTTQARGMGEGWGDFTALLMTTEEGDRQRPGNAQLEGAYAGAVYDTESPVTATNGYYFGFRRAPYSTSFSKNALTFRHIANGAALPTTHPMAPAAPANAEVHNTGEIWASMLWESYVALLNAQPRLSFSQAQSRMLDYVVAGLSAMPSQPTFTESRDAMLAVAAANDLEDYRLMLRAFAKRGLGTRAVSPPRNGESNSPLTEDFNDGNDLVLASATLDDEVLYCDRDGVLDVGEQGRLRLTIRNTGVGTLAATTATVTTNLTGAMVGSFTFPSVAPLQTATAEATVRLPTLQQPTAFIVTITFADPTLPMPGTRTVNTNFAVNYDDLPASLASDNAEPLPTAWTFASAPTPATDFTWSRTTQGALAHRYFGPNPAQPGDIWLVSPALAVGPTAFGFTFTHRYDFEEDEGTAYDGAVIELTTDDGATWTDIGAQVSPGYNVTLDNEPAGTNPLKGRPAFGAQSPAYPAWTNATVALGTTYAGQTVKVRLRIGADTNTAGAGWEVDDFVFTGITNTPFPSRVGDRRLCINRPPVANAGVDFAVDEGAQATLNSSASTDPDMNMLTATWTQVSGPAVTLVNGNQFTAPPVTADTDLVFSLVVNDGTVDSLAADEVMVTVRNLNAPPVVTVSATQTVDERSSFIVEASAVDPEGDTLSIEWRQVSGPTALLGDTRAWRLQGAAPEVTANAVMVFEATVRDAMNTAKAQVTVNVTQVNRAPTVRLLAATPVDADAVVNVEALANDADGDMVTITWRQVSGPSVTWDSVEPSRIEFRAPAAGSRVVLEATASDGLASSVGTATIDVRATTSTAPRAVVTAGVTVESGGTVQLSAAGSSGAGTLQYQWEQVGLGSRLTFDSTSAQTVTVTAPVVTTRERLNVQLRVRDASGQVASAVTFVLVEPKAASGCGCVATTGFDPLLGLVALVLLRRRRRVQR